MISEAASQKEHYFDSILISGVAILVWVCIEAGITLSPWEIFAPIVISLTITSILAFLRKKQRKDKGRNASKVLFDSSLINPVSFGFQCLCVFWLMLLLRKIRGLQEGQVDELLMTALIVGVTIALCFGVLSFIYQKIDRI